MPSSIACCSLALAAMLLLAWAPSADGQNRPLGEFDGHSDVGGARPGRATFDARAGEYRITGSGANMWEGRDEFHVVWKRMRGDFILTARARFEGTSKQPHRKMGWIVRRSLEPGAEHAAAVVHGDGLTSLQFRRAAAGPTEESKLDVTGPDVVQLERQGSALIMSAARFGDPLESERIEHAVLGDAVLVGLFVCSHDAATLETAVFRDVRITVPAKAGFVPYRDYIGSRLELLDVETGRREVVHTDPGSIQAPNWTPDGRALIFNKDGRLYRFDLKTRRPVAIDTGFATSNNNDHVLSFDGKMLGISHHSADDGGRSIVYVLPAAGGTPKRVTAKGPSYLHGWSPDGKWVIYTAERNGEYDIYRAPSSGGAETRLTDAKGLDDGSEYSPDGRYIYFNSTRSGTMQLWRMGADGSNPERVTHDGLNDWFPHVSPDGRWLVFLTFGTDVAPDDHPFYKRVTIRRMPIAGGAPRVIAYLYGGQGTINVPSWSPDGKRVAFVSNTDEVRSAESGVRSKRRSTEY
jgi:TolB protein